MMEMTDTFIKYLDTELDGNPPIHWLRADDNEELANAMKFGALNISTLSWYQNGSQEEALISLDIIGSSDRIVMGWVKRVRDVLVQSLYTPEYDYVSTPGTEISTGKAVRWNINDVSFEVRGVDHHAVHVNATFSICHSR